MRDRDLGREEESWMQLFRLIRDQFPYSKARDVVVRGGTVRSFKEVDLTFVFGRGAEPPRPLVPDTFDDQWKRFMRFCRALRNGVLGEVHFSDGRPVRVSMQHGGMELGVQSSLRIRGQGGEAA